MIRFALWGAATVLLLLMVVDALASGQPPSWWMVLVAFFSGCGVLQIAHVLYEERQEDQNEEEAPEPH